MKYIFTSIFILLLGLSLTAQIERKVIVEHFTNTKCGICASKNPAFNQLMEDHPEVIRLTFHPSSPYSTCIFSQHNPYENDARTNHYGIYGGTPRVVLQGGVIGIQTPLLKADQLEAELGQSSDFTVEIEHTNGPGDDRTVKVTITRVTGNDGTEYQLYVALAEAFIDYNAPNGETEHHNVFREVLMDESFTLTAGNSLVFTDTYSAHPDWDMGQIRLVALIQDEGNEVKQAAQSDFATGGSAGIGDRIELAGDLFYPNPAKDIIRLREGDRERFIRAEVFDLLGSKMLESSLAGEIRIGDLPEGLYFVILTDRENRKYTTKILKSGR